MTLAKILFVACMTSLGWLYTFILSQYFFYQGGRAGGHDMGVLGFGGLIYGMYGERLVDAINE